MLLVSSNSDIFRICVLSERSFHRKLRHYCLLQTGTTSCTSWCDSHIQLGFFGSRTASSLRFFWYLLLVQVCSDALNLLLISLLQCILPCYCAMSHPSILVQFFADFLLFSALFYVFIQLHAHFLDCTVWNRKTS